MAAGGTPGNVRLGPGRLYYAPLGTAEPTSATAALPSAWQVIGYTEDGTEITTDISSEDIEVAEELEAIDTSITKVKTQVKVTMAEATKRRLLLALGAGATAADDTTPFEAPGAADIVAVMLVHDTDLGDTPGSTNSRTLFRSVKPSGTISVVNRKAPAKRSISATFDASKPNGSTAAWKKFPAANGRL